MKAEYNEYLTIHLRNASFTQGLRTLAENGNGGCEFALSEEGLAVNLGVGIVGVWVTRGAFYSCPLADGAVPSHYAVQNTAVVLEEQRKAGKSSKSQVIQLKVKWREWEKVDTLSDFYKTSELKTGRVYLELRLD